MLLGFCFLNKIQSIIISQQSATETCCPLSSLGECVQRKASWEIFTAIVHLTAKVFTKDKASLGPMHELLVTLRLVAA